MTADGATSTQPTLRRGTPDDIRECHDLLWASITDFAVRNGTPLEGSADDWWRTGESVHRHLAADAAEWWVAVDADTGEILGYGRSIDRNGLLELTELFVRPGRQSAGLGRALIERAFPIGRGEARAIVAVGDVRALTRYYRAGTAIRFAIMSFSGTPRVSDPAGDLAPVRVRADQADAVAEIAAIDEAVVGFRRGVAELAWLLSSREAYLYRRGEETVGASFIGREGVGPILAVDPVHLPGILLHVETRAVELGIDRLELEVPSVDATAVNHLLDRGFQLSPWLNHFMSDRPFGRFDRYVCFSPPILF